MDLKKILPNNGPPVNEVSKYIEKYKNDLIVISMVVMFLLIEIYLIILYQISVF